MKSILIIEIDAMVRRFLCAALQASNYSVVEAESDVTSGCCTGKYRHHRARLHGNPGGRLENVEKAAHRSRTHVPVIAMSGLGQYGYDLPLWASACLVKPFRPSQLIRKIQGLPAQTGQTLLPDQHPAPALAAALRFFQQFAHQRDQ
jgi:DNA-binding response OmpR family regulator